MIAISLVLLLSFSTHAAEPLYTLSTEEYPPYSYLGADQKQVLGFSTEKVIRLMNRSGFDYKINLYPWMRAYSRAQLGGPRYCVFSTARNPDRENLFHWIGPLLKVEWALFAKEGSPAASVRTLEDAKKYLIGGLEGDASAEEMKKLGFKVESVVSNWLNNEKLQGQRVQLWIDDPVYVAYQLKKENKVSDYIKVVTFKYSDLYLACNLQTPLEEIKKLQKELTKLGR